MKILIDDGRGDCEIGEKRKIEFISSGEFEAVVVMAMAKRMVKWMESNISIGFMIALHRELDKIYGWKT